MSLLDTGLGWSADGEFLRSTDGFLTNTVAVTTGITGWTPINVTANFPLPADYAAYEAADRAKAEGTLIVDSTTDYNYIFAIADSPDCYIARRGSGDYVAISPNRRAKIFVAMWRGISTRYDYKAITGDGAGDAVQWNTTPINNMYYKNYSMSNPRGTLTFFVPDIYTDSADYCNSFTTTVSPWYKLNSGYSIAIVIKWRSSPLTQNLSVLLISSDPSFTVISGDGSTQSSRYYSRVVSYSGIRFTVGFVTMSPPESVSGQLILYRDLSDAIYRSVDELFRAVARISSLTVTETVDPYAPIDPSGENAGDGDFDDTDDDIPMSPLPSLSFASTGFCRVYSPTLAQLSALATYMWTDQTFLQTLANHVIQLLEDPMQAVISLSLVPCSPHVGPAESVKVLFIPISGVSMYPVTDQFTDVECGTLTVSEYYGSALDYNPYTKISCFLPFIGTDEVMGKTLSITYRIDVVSGACTAIIKADGDVYYQFSGHCSVQMPVTSADFSGYVAALMSTAKLVAGIGAAAAGAPELGGSLLGAPPSGSPSTTTTTTSGGAVTLTTRNPETGRQVTSGRVTTDPETRETVHTPGGINLGELSVRATMNTVGAVMNSKVGIQHSGGFSGISGFLGLRYPYLIIKRPRLCNPNQYGQYNGRPSMIYANLGECTGYTSVQAVQLTGIPATNPEMSEIATLLKSGVIL